jgi:DNA-binding Lrp family transcriptional regulator
MSVDDIDRKIIRLLDDDATLTYEEIGRLLRKDKGTIRKRVLALLKNRIIHFDIRIDSSRLGYKAEAELELDVDPSKTLEVGKALPNIPGVRMAFSAAGAHDYIVIVLAEDQNALRKIVDQILSIEGVVKVIPNIITSRIK